MLGLHLQVSQPGGGVFSSAALTAAALVTRLFPLSICSQSCGMGAMLGRQSTGELWGSQPWQGLLPAHCISLPLLFPQFKHRLCQL